MKKFNLLGSYPNPKNKRYVSENLRTIKHRIIASYRGKEFYDGKTNQIELVYTEYQSAMTQTALYKTVLPFEVEQIAKEIESVGSYTFEPSASQVLSNIIPKYTNATIFSALLNASTSEHAARMRAMKAATENAEELIKILSRQSNQARQAEITTEISEIVGGAEALAG